MRLAICSAAALLAMAHAAFAQTADAPPAPSSAATEEAPAQQLAPAPAADPNVYQVLRPGDRELSCQALGDEANALNASLLAEQKAAAKKAGRGRLGRQVAGNTAGGAMKIGGRMMLGRVIGGMTPFGGLVAVAANDALADSAGQAIARGDEAEAAPVVSPEQQRMNHLLGLYREKGC
ncbi:hypothetical protein [Phenylobacterium sp.]|uniref:hypothetical protein n=1 Tax=Phenylobacterium sp. TaxID=1871053 RepID=UPI002E30D05A|nr:hypothetical protein [Phenylobacterium sp.]HEX2561206.1 hypothetical protein [Phenylobacterium sp.]